MLPIRILIVVAGACAALEAGCGASDGMRPEQPTVRADASSPLVARGPRAAVAAALLQRRVLGDGWTAEPPVKPIACPAVDPWRDATMKRSSKLIQFNDSVALQQTIAVLPSAAEARHASAALRSRPAQACFERALKRQIAERKGVRGFGPMVVVREAPEEQRSTISSNQDYGKVTSTVDEIRTQAGRLLADTVVISGPEPIEEQLYSSLVALVTRRLHAATAAFAGVDDGA